MIHLKSIQLQNFRSFHDATIEFPARGLFLIKGKDVETGESSGTGKSAVFLGLAYLLDILPSEFNAKALQNWDSEEDLQVTGVFADGDRQWVLGRGKKTFVKPPEGKTKTGSKAYAEALQELFGVTADVLQALTYRPQGKPGFFLGMGPADKVKFLTDVLGLNAVEDAVKAAQDKIKIDEPLTATLQQRVRDVLTEFETEKAVAVPEAGDPALLLKHVDECRHMQGVLRAEVDKLERGVREAEALERGARGDAAGEKKLELQQARALREALQRDAQETLKARRAQAAQLRAQAQPLRDALARADLQDQDLRTVRDAITAWEAAVCPTCDQKWEQDQVRRKRLQDRLEALEAEVALRPRRRQALEDLEAQIRAAETLPPPDPRLERLLAVEQQLTQALAALTSVQDSDRLRDLRSELAETRGSLQQVEVTLTAKDRELAQVNARNEARESLLKAKNARLDRLRAAIRDAEEKLRAHEQGLAQERDFVAVLGREGFLGVIFEDILAEIAADANRRFARLANVREVSLEFSTETEAGRRQIKAFVTVRGHRGRPDVICSGGMLTSVEQVVDMAVIAVVARRCPGRLPAWICLDEVTNGQGPVTKEAALEVLRDAAADRLVLVIDHGTEFKEAFESTLDIEFQAGVSRVSQKGLT